MSSFLAPFRPRARPADTGKKSAPFWGRWVAVSSLAAPFRRVRCRRIRAKKVRRFGVGRFQCPVLQPHFGPVRDLRIRAKKCAVFGLIGFPCPVLWPCAVACCGRGERRLPFCRLPGPALGGCPSRPVAGSRVGVGAVLSAPGCLLTGSPVQSAGQPGGRCWPWWRARAGLPRAALRLYFLVNGWQDPSDLQSYYSTKYKLLFVFSGVSAVWKSALSQALNGPPIDRGGRGYLWRARGLFK